MATTNWWDGLTVATDPNGRRIGGGRVLDTGWDTSGWDQSYMAQLAAALGLGDLWKQGYFQQDRVTKAADGTETVDAFSPELRAALDQKLQGLQLYRLGARPGQNDQQRQFAVADPTGKVVWGSDPYSHSNWYDAPLEAAGVLGTAYLGASALNGGLLGLGGAAADSGMTAAGALAQGSQAAGAAVPAAGGTSMLTESMLAPSIAQGAPLATTGTIPIAQTASMSQIPALAGAAGAGGAGAAAGGVLGTGLTPSQLLKGAAAGATLLGAAGAAGGAGGGNPANVNGAAQQSANVAQQALDFYKQEMLRTQGLRDQSTELSNKVAQAQLDALLKNTALADEYAAYNRDTFRPLEKQLVADAQGYDTPERRMQAMAQAQADVERAVTGQRDASMRASRRMGFTPTSGRALAMNTQMDLGAAKLKAGASQNAVNNVEQQGYARRMDAAALGRNLPSQQATSQQIATQAGNSAVNNSQAGVNTQYGGAGLMGQGFNTGLQGLRTAGDLYGQAARIEAGQGTDLNGIANLARAGGYLWDVFSDEKIKKDTKKPASTKRMLSQVEDVPVKREWKYDPAKGGPDDGGMPHDGPMAGDVQRVMGDDVAPGGKVIDPITMMGRLTGAVQELSKRVGRMEKAVQR